MKTGTRLLLVLLPIVAAVMMLYALWALHQREQTVISEARERTEAYASALGLALEQAFEDLEVQAVQNIVSQASLERRIYRVQVFNAAGALIARSDTGSALSTGWRDRIEEVVMDGVATSFYADVDDRPVYTVLRPLRDDGGGVRAGLEVVQPLDVVTEETANIRRRFLFNTVTLLLALSAASLIAVHRSITLPLKRLVAAVRAVGGGELTYRVPPGSGGSELKDLAQEFNKMAGSLEVARVNLIRESEGRLELDRQIRQTEQVAAVGRLAVSLAHEIAAPLNVISGRSELLSKRGDIGPEFQRNLRIITEQINRISNTVRHLLDLTRRPAVRRVPLDLNSTLDSIVELLEGELLRARVTVTRVGSPGWVIGDPDQIHQVLINVILNAIQAMEVSEGEHELTIRGERSNKAAGGEVVQLDIVDTGIGIPEDLLDKLFEPFVTSKDGGTGVGLAVAFGIVEELGGEIVASNRLDRSGAIFSITIPGTSRPDGFHD